MNNELSMGTNLSTVTNTPPLQLPPDAPPRAAPGSAPPIAPGSATTPATLSGTAAPGASASEVQSGATSLQTSPGPSPVLVRTRPEPIAIDSSLGEVLEMPEAEQQKLYAMESAIELALADVCKNFVQIGLALTEIRKGELYAEFGTFEEYCRQRWNFAHSKANYLMKAAAAFQSIAGLPDLPTPDRESPLRPLLHLTPDAVQRVWKTAVERSGGRKITARLIKNVVHSLNLSATRPEPRTPGTTLADRHRQITDCFGQVLTLLSQRADYSSVLGKIQELHTLVEGLFVKRHA